MENIKVTSIFAKNLSYLLELNNETVKSLSESLDVPYSTVSDWKNGKKMPRSAALQSISNHFGVNLSDLMNEEDGITGLTVKIPCYGSVAAGALAEIEGRTVEEVAEIEIPIALLGKYVGDKGIFMMKVNGNSMNKVIPNSSYVIAKPDDGFKDGDIVIFSHDEGYSLKRYMPHAVAGSILFKAETTDSRIKDIVVPFDTDNDLKIYGKVIWYSVTLD